MRYISLFAGIGGFDLALNRLGHTCVWANEWDKYAAEIFNKNFTETGGCGQEEVLPIRRGGDTGSEPDIGQHPFSCDTRDITTVPTGEIPDHDLLVGGFPCQAFSIAGKRRGFDDTRGTLFFEIARIVRDKAPKYLLLENVKGLISHNEGKTLEIILETLQELGYYTNIEVYNSKNFGVPQNRERIFFICRHIKTLLEDGQSQKTIISRTIIQEYLFQVLLNNLAEVKKLQEHNSKDLVVGYLLLKEINQNLNQSGENILGGIWTPTEEKSCRLKEEVWQNTDTWLSKNLGENYQELNKSTILTVINEIIESKIYTYSQMQKAILLAIVHLRESSKDLWNEVLSNLIVFQENTKYERVNVEKEKVVITEGRDAYIGERYNSARERVFIVGHLRGERRPEVFPIGNTNATVNEGYRQTDTAGEIASTIRNRYGNGTGSHIEVVGTLESNGWEKRHEQIRRVHGIDGISPTIPTGTGGGVMTKVAIPVLTPDRSEKRQNGRRFKEDGEPSFTLTGQDRHGISDGMRIRRLTPLEAERLQGFPAGWTEGVSDTQRYKCLGNAVTVNVVEEIAKRL